MRKDSGAGLVIGSVNGSVSNKSLQESKTRLRNLIISVIFGLFIPIGLPLGHMILFRLIWGNMVNPVDPKTCTCNCWDTMFKGPYETGIAGYKHVYFNSTLNTLKMWIITVLGVVSLYECFKHVALLAFKKRLRGTMLLLFFSSLHSHYYGWWAHWNYWNDDFYTQWAHQFFFTCTELAATACVLSNLDKRKSMNPLGLVFIGNIALFHILSSGLDQFFLNVFFLRGQLHQVLRDVLLMSTDILQVGVVLYELKKCAEQKGISLKQIISQRPHLICCGINTAVMLLYLVLY